jgi:hypothetical protein
MGVTENPDKRDFIAARLRALADEVMSLPGPKNAILIENTVVGDEDFMEHVSSWTLFMSTDVPIEAFEDPPLLAEG